MSDVEDREGVIDAYLKSRMVSLVLVIGGIPRTFQVTPDQKTRILKKTAGTWRAELRVKANDDLAVTASSRRSTPNLRPSVVACVLILRRIEELERRVDELEGNGSHERNGHLLALGECEWRCQHCGHQFDAAVDAELFACGESCTGKHPGDAVAGAV